MGVVPPFPASRLDAVDEVLTTTRAIRRRLDLSRPVDPAVVRECIDLAVHAPSAGDRQNWHWVVVTDPELRAAIAGYYRQGWESYRSGISDRARRRRGRAEERNSASARWLAEHLHQVPVLVIPFVAGRAPGSRGLGGDGDPVANHFASVMYYGSAFPAVWSLQLALRSRGLGSVMTSVTIPYAAEISQLLGVPRIMTQICVLPVGHVLGDEVRRAPRAAASISWDRWCADD